MTRRVGGRRRTERRSPSEPLVETELETFEPATPQSAVLRLQTDSGNAAVARLLARQPETATSPGPITSPSQLDKPTEAEAAEPPVTRTGVEGAQDWFDRAVAHYDGGRYEKALHAFEEAYKLYPQANFLYNEAACLDRLGRKEEAADMYGRYLAGNPTATDAAKVKKRIAKLRGEAPPKASEPQAEHTAEGEAPITAIGEEGARAWFDRGQQAYLGEDYLKAARDFRQAFLLKPLPAFVFNEASALEKARRPEAAANAFEHYLVLEPGAHDAKETIERIKKLRGEAAEKDALMDPNADEPSAPAVTATGKEGARQWFDRGTVAYELRDYKRAYDAFVQAYDLSPQPEIVYNQAASLDRMGNADAAVQAYERYLALAPKATDAEKVRRRIKHLREAPAGTGLKKP
jgi:tetratricopeptide (TPR) repeat protein